MELSDLMKSLDGMVQEQKKAGVQKGNGKRSHTKNGKAWEQHPDGTKSEVQKSHERIWIPLAAYLRIEEQVCDTCGASHRYTRGFWELQKSGKITRSVLVPSADKFQLWLAEPQTVPVCPSCLAIPGELYSTVDQILAALDRQAGEHKQGKQGKLL